MNLIDPILAEFAAEAANTKKTLERVPEEHFSWKPHNKSFSMAELASHIAETPGWISGIVGVDEMDLDTDMEGYQPFLAGSKAELMQKFEEGVSGAETALRELTDQEVLQTWRMKSGGKVVMESSRGDVIRNVLINHIIHHRGQLTVYLRLKDVPVPGLYGPSADEKSF